MNAYTHFRSALRSALALLLLLAGGILTTASAQPAEPDEMAVQMATISRTLSTPSARAELTTRQWKDYARQLTDALASGHDGFQQGALRIIIHHGDNMRFKRSAVFDAVRIYRDHPNDDMRRLAVVALSQMHDAWAIDFLRRSAPFEKTPRVRHTILAVLKAHDAVKTGPAKVTG